MVPKMGFLISRAACAHICMVKMNINDAFIARASQP